MFTSARSERTWKTARESTDQKAVLVEGKRKRPGWAQIRGWPAQCPGVPLHRQGHPKILSEPLRRKHLRDPPLSGGASAPPPVRTKGQAAARPDRTRTIPCKLRAGHRGEDRCAISVPLAAALSGMPRSVCMAGQTQLRRSIRRFASSRSALGGLAQAAFWLKVGSLMMLFCRLR
jgi:hypothetical protein